MGNLRLADYFADPGGWIIVPAPAEREARNRLNRDYHISGRMIGC